MQNKYTALILLASLMTAPAAAPAAPLSDAALASYISGRLKQALSDEDRTVEQRCDESGCAVVVQ